MANTITSINPAKAAGEHISNVIREHNGDVVCFLSGGSALDVVEYIEVPDMHKKECQDISTSNAICRTIFMMGDERGSGDSEINNYLQLATRYPGHAVTEQLIETVPRAGESLENFATRIEKKILKKISELYNVKIISLLGVGTDGHTAGIFPMNKSSFEATYGDVLTYVPVYREGLRIDSRASLTPEWILRNVDEVLGYLVGTDKQDILVKLNSESKKLHERPAELLKLHMNSTIYTDTHMSTS